MLFSSGSLFLGAALLSSFQEPEPQANSDYATAPSYDRVDASGSLTFEEALRGGRTWLNLRYRAEGVEQDGFSRDAFASTLRTVIGYETAAWNNLQVAIEVEDTAQVGDDQFDSRVNGKTQFPVVIDPTGTTINQAYFDYHGLADTLVRVGRQEIILDNGRYFANAGWRQNHRSYDGVLVRNNSIDGLTVTLGYIDDVNTIFAGVRNTETGIFNVGYDWAGVGRVVGYLYRYDVQSMPTRSTSTVGLRFSGDQALGEESSVTYEAEFASQTDISGNPNDVDADYSKLALGARFSGVTARVGLETLGGSGQPGDAFQTPFAFLHRNNGFADIFAPGTPDTGLQDFRFGLAGKIGEVSATATYHFFDADSGNLEYGNELDVVLSYPLSESATLSFKYADFSAEDAFVDTRKAMLWLSYVIL